MPVEGNFVLIMINVMNNHVDSFFKYFEVTTKLDIACTCTRIKA